MINQAEHLEYKPNKCGELKKKSKNQMAFLARETFSYALQVGVRENTPTGSLPSFRAKIIEGMLRISCLR